MKVTRTLLIIATLATATLIFALFTAYLLAQPQPEWRYFGAYQNSLLFQSEQGYLAYDVSTHETVMAQSYRGIIDAVKNK